MRVTVWLGVIQGNGIGRLGNLGDESQQQYVGYVVRELTIPSDVTSPMYFKEQYY